jgi:hypothetical protein
LGPFLRPTTPEFRRILLIESGSRAVAERWLTWLGKTHPNALCDILTCYLGVPGNHDFGERVFRTSAFPTAALRTALMTELRRQRHDVIVALCTNEDIMTRWKWYAVWKVGVPTLLLNENGDWVEFHRREAKTLLRFLAYRLGLSGAGALTQPLRLLAFPFVILYLAMFAAYIHVRRKVTA